MAICLRDPPPRPRRRRRRRLPPRFPPKTTGFATAAAFLFAICSSHSPSFAGAAAYDADNAAGTCSSVDEFGVCNDMTSLYVIGDIHGDANCAVAWVNRTGLVSNLFLDVDAGDDAASTSTSPTPLHQRLQPRSQWKWTDPTSKIVFMGDYVDKGPTSKQTVELVRDLTAAFPDRVTAILGNHELELLRDREASDPVARYGAYSYATVHPGEYLNYFSSGAGDDGNGDKDSSPSTRALDKHDELVLGQLLEAGLEVYAANAHSAVRYVPSLGADDAARPKGVMYAITDIIPPEYRDLARERLGEYQEVYLNTYRSNAPLGQWLERQPLLHYAEDVRTLFVHGGISPGVASGYLSDGKVGTDEINAAWYKHSTEGKLSAFLQNDMIGYVAYELVTYRGNHPGYAEWESHGTVDEDAAESDETCNALRKLLNTMDGIDRIVVGHTPDFDVRVMCDGAFIAADSMIGRWIRGSGNEYCPGPGGGSGEGKGDIHKTSRNGKYTCPEIKSECEGQIVRLDSDGSVNILAM